MHCKPFGHIANFDMHSLKQVYICVMSVELNCLNQVKIWFGFEFSRKPWFSVFKSYPENSFQNLSIFWGWAQKQKCRACQVIQSLFLEFSKLFRKIWSNLKRRDSLNVPFLNSNLHFKMYTKFGDSYKSKVVELFILNNFYFWRFLSCYTNLGVIWIWKRMAIL